MEKIQVIKDIILLPKNFYDDGNASVYTLLKESGYFELHSQISEADILEELVRHLEFIEQWLILSEDKRSSSGWYFKKIDSGKYVVGYIPPKENLKTIEYVNKEEACAAFIKREIEEVRNS